MAEWLDEAAPRAGFDGVEALCFFREPCAHAVSTYFMVHGRNPGVTLPFETFLRDVFKLPQEVQRYLALQDNLETVRFTTRRYTPDGLADKLAAWLSLDAAFERPAMQRLNTSLSAAEAHVVIGANETHPAMGQLLRERFAQLPRDSKADDRAVLDHYVARAHAFFAGLDHHPAQVQTLFPPQDGPFDPVVCAGDAGDGPQEIGLSDAQLAAILAAARDSRESAVLRRKARSLLRRLGARFGRRG
jgi:hypothetical protein